MTATKIDVIATRSIQSNRWCNAQDVQRAVAPRNTRRCLFGPPDRDELQKIYKRNLETERQRMLNNYGFDVKTEKYVGHGVGVQSTTFGPGDKKNCTGSNRLCNNNQNNNKKTSDYKPYKQTCLTDFYSTKKNKDKEEKRNSTSSNQSNSQSFSRKNVNKV